MSKSTFFLRQQLIATADETFVESELDLGAYVNLGSTKPQVLRVHSVQVQFSDSQGLVPTIDAAASVGEWNAKKIGNSKRYVSYNIYKAKKQIFFAHRFVNYGIDVLKYGKIRDLKAWNDIWEILKNDDNFTVDG